MPIRIVYLRDVADERRLLREPSSRLKPPDNMLCGGNPSVFVKRGSSRLTLKPVRVHFASSAPATVTVLCFCGVAHLHQFHSVRSLQTINGPGLARPLASRTTVTIENIRGMTFARAFFRARLVSTLFCAPSFTYPGGRAGFFLLPLAEMIGGKVIANAFHLNDLACFSRRPTISHRTLSCGLRISLTITTA